MHFAEPHRILYINLIDKVFKLIIELQLVGLKWDLEQKDEEIGHTFLQQDSWSSSDTSYSLTADSDGPDAPADAHSYKL